ncbi:unnamed protein product [Durusdinium trenchii]|uniref:Uncharacterized protein n=1 Tax=Durusdinium trenchii TaxID=1381693 RepID=A0ABP0JU89_9DINO
MAWLLAVFAVALLLGVVSAELRVEREPRHAPRSGNQDDVQDCEAISWADLCERQLISGDCFQLQPGTSPAMRCQLRGPASAHAPLRPAQLRAAAQGVVTTCGTPGELRITGQIQMISLRLEAETIVFEDAQVEAWHETPDLSIETGGAFHSEGPLTLTRSNLTVKTTGAKKGGGLAAVDLILVSSSLQVLNATAFDSGGGFYGKGTLRLRELSKVLIENVVAKNSFGGGFVVEGDADISDSGLIDIKNASSGRGGGGFFARNFELTNHSTLRVQNATAEGFGGGFIASNGAVIAGNSTLNLQTVKAETHGGGFLCEAVDIGGGSTVKISNSHAETADGGGFSALTTSKVSNGSSLIIVNATARNGGGFVSNDAAICNSTVTIQHATATAFGGGFLALEGVVIDEKSNVNISDSAALNGGGFHGDSRLQVTNQSTLNLQNVKARNQGGGFNFLGEVDISGDSTVKISNSETKSGDGGGFYALKGSKVSNGSSLLIVNATARNGGGFVSKDIAAMCNSTVSIQHATARESGGGFVAFDGVVIDEMSVVSISGAVAGAGGGGFSTSNPDKRLQVTNQSTLNLQNVKAKFGGGGFLSQGEVEIGGSSAVKISDSHTDFGDGGGFEARKELRVSNGSTLVIRNATAGGLLGGGFYAGGKVAVRNSTVSIQHAASGQYGGGFFANGGIALVDASTVAMSDTHAGVDGGGFKVATVLAIHNSSMSMANSTAARTGTAGHVDGQVLLSSQSSLDIHQAKGDGNSAVLVASCLQLHPESNVVLDGIIGGHGLDLQNSCSFSPCTNTTFQVADSAALSASGRLSSGLLSAKVCPHEEVRLSGIHLCSWNSSLLTTRPTSVVVDDVSIHYQPPVNNLQILAAQDSFSIDSLAISCPDCPQGVTFKATEDGILQALSPEDLQCSKTFTVSNNMTPRCDCRDPQITNEDFGNRKLVSLKEVFQTCMFCNRHSYFQDGICLPCEIYRGWSDGERDVCHWLPRKKLERVILITGAAVLVILTFIVFEILHAPLVILDARSDMEDPSDMAAKKIFTISVQGPIASLPKSISQLVHKNIHYRASGTDLQWLDFDPQKPKAIKVCSLARRKLLLQDAHVPVDCASCRGSLDATETSFLFTLLIALFFVLAMLPTMIIVTVMSRNGFEHTFVSAVLYLALPMVVVAVVLHWPVSWLIQRLYRRTPFSEALDDYQKQIHCKPHPGPDATHPRNQGLLVLTLRGLWKHFESFILDRNMHFVVANIVRPLTQSKGVSFVTLWGGREVDYFVSHSWGTSFAHFVHSIRCHALSKEGPTFWMDAAYWICSFANNQWNIAAELADDPMDSAFARALRGGIKGVAMVLDRDVQPLTRVWCLFEFLLSSREQLELVFTTNVGVVGDDRCKSFDIALEVGKKIQCLQVAKCQASSEEDKRKIFEYIINTLGSLEKMDDQIRHLMGEMLEKNLTNAGSAADSLLRRLRRK